MTDQPDSRFFAVERRKAPRLNEKGLLRIVDPDGFQEHLETHPEPWQQHELEPNDVYALFLQYLSLPGTRNMSKMFKRVKEAGYNQYSIAWIEEVSHLYRWQFRTEQYDAYMLKDYEADIKIASRLMKTRRVSIINKLFNIAEDMIDRVNWDDVKPKDAIELLKVTLSLSQLEFPELNPKTNININNRVQVANVSPQTGVANSLDLDDQNEDAIKSIEDDRLRRDELIRLIATNPQFQHAISGNARLVDDSKDDEVYSSAAYHKTDEPKAKPLPAPSE